MMIWATIISIHPSERLALPKSIVPSRTSVGLRLGEWTVVFKRTVCPRVRPRVTIWWRLDGLVGFFVVVFLLKKKTRWIYTYIAGFIYSLSF